jgi:hypothetical protein
MLTLFIASLFEKPELCSSVPVQETIWKTARLFSVLASLLVPLWSEHTNSSYVLNRQRKLDCPFAHWLIHVCCSLKWQNNQPAF